jgi:hypothetical protein
VREWQKETETPKDKMAERQKEKNDRK